MKPRHDHGMLWPAVGGRVRLSVPRNLPFPGSAQGDVEAWPLVRVIACYLVLFGLMTWPWLLGYVTIPWDAKAHFQPQIQFLAQSLARGEWPWWNPYVFSGQPQVADPQSMIFSPPFLVLALLSKSPSLRAVDATVLATMAAGGCGLIFWFRDRGLHWAGAIVAALVFSFGAAMAWRVQHTGQVMSLAYWPWALLLLDRAVERGSKLAGIGCGLVGAAIVLGRDQVGLLCMYLLAGRVVWHIVSDRAPRAVVRRALAPLGLGALVGLSVVAVPVLMTVLLAGDSNRPTIDFIGAGRGSLHPMLLLTMVAPNVFGAGGHMADYWGPPSFAWQGTDLFIAQNVGQAYIGALPLLLIICAAFAKQLWARDVRFFTISFVVVLLYALGWYTPAFRGLYEALPGINLYRRPADAVFHVGALAAILAGYAVHRFFAAPWEQDRSASAIVCVGIVAAGLVAAIAAGWNFDRLDRLPGPLLSALGFFLVALIVMLWAAPRIALTPWRVALALALATTVDLGWNNGPSTSSALPPSYYDVLEPNTRNAVITTLKSKVRADGVWRDRIELAGLGFHWPNASETHRLENTLGYNPVRLGLYSRATGAEDHVGLPDQRKFKGLMPSYHSLLADMLGLRWIATGAPIETMDAAAAGHLKRVAETPDGWIYENPDVLPRVMLVGGAQTVSFDGILQSGRWPDFEPAKTVLLERMLPLPAKGAGAEGKSIRIAAYRNTQIVIETKSDAPELMLLNDIWHPWWFAEVDGVPAEMLRANVLFRAVQVPRGQHVVTLTFRPFAGMLKSIRGRRLP